MKTIAETIHYNSIIKLQAITVTAPRVVVLPRNGSLEYDQNMAAIRNIDKFKTVPSFVISFFFCTQKQ